MRSRRLRRRRRSKGEEWSRQTAGRGFGGFCGRQMRREAGGGAMYWAMWEHFETMCWAQNGLYTGSRIMGGLIWSKKRLWMFVGWWSTTSGYLALNGRWLEWNCYILETVCVFIHLLYGAFGIYVLFLVSLPILKCNTKINKPTFSMIYICNSPQNTHQCASRRCYGLNSRRKWAAPEVRASEVKRRNTVLHYSGCPIVRTADAFNIWIQLECLDDTKYWIHLEYIIFFRCL